MSGRSVRVPEAGTVGTMDAFGLRGKIPGGIQRDEPGVADGAHLLQHPRPVKRLVEIVKETEQMTWRNRIERLADVIVAGDAFDLEERAGVAATRFCSMACWKLRNEGHWEKKTANADSAMSAMANWVLSPVRRSGRAAATERRRSTRGSKPGAFMRPEMPGRGQKYKLQSCDNGDDEMTPALLPRIQPSRLPFARTT